jgi:hypothetical protein
MIEFTIARTSTAPIERLFDVMTDHRRLADTTWLFRRSTLEREGTPAPNGVGAIRRLTSIGTTFVEEIVEYQRPTLWAYTLLSGAPVRGHLGTIALRELETGTEVHWHLQAELTIPGLGGTITPVFKTFIDQLLRGAITAAERARRQQKPSSRPL